MMVNLIPKTVIALAVFILGLGKVFTDPDGHTVLIGGVLPLSKNEDNQCGSLRLSAVEEREAMIFAIHSINEDPTLLPNVNLTYDLKDSCSIPNKALEASISYVQAPVSGITENHLAMSGIVGAGQFSAISEALASLFRLFQIPQISYESPAVTLSDRTRFDYFFRTVPSDVFLAQGLADIFAYFNWSYIMILHSDDIYRRTGHEVILSVTGKQNATKQCVAVDIEIPVLATEEEFDDIVAQMNQPWVQNSTVAYLYGYPSQTSGILRAIRRLLKREPQSPIQSLIWLGFDALLVDEEYNDLLLGMLRLEYDVNISHGFQQYFTSLTAQDVVNDQFLSKYWETRFNCSFNATENDCNDYNLTNYEQKTRIASIIDAVYAFAHAIHNMIHDHCPDGSLCPKITVHRPAGIAVNGTMIRDYLLYNISFPGLSAPMVNFDSNGNDQSRYVVKNLQRTSDNRYEHVTVGKWDPVNFLKLYPEEIVWHSGRKIPESACSRPCPNGYFQKGVEGLSECCWTCHECVGDNTISNGVECETCERGNSPNPNRSKCIANQIYYLTRNNPWGVIFVAASCLGLAATSAIGIIFVTFHKHKVVKASSRELSAILLVGIAMAFTLPFFYLEKPSVTICIIRNMLLGISFATSFSALLIKTNRLYRIFIRSAENFRTTPPRFVSPLSQVVICFILIGIQVVFTVVWLSLDNHQTEFNYANTYTELVCGESPVVALIVSLGYNLLLLILSTYFAFLARKIPENFNEAKFINATLYTIIILWLVFLSTYFAFASANLGAGYQTTSLVTAIILTATTTLCCLFVPKIFLLASQLRKERNIKSSFETGFSTKTVSSNGEMMSKGKPANKE